MLLRVLERERLAHGCGKKGVVDERGRVWDD